MSAKALPTQSEMEQSLGMETGHRRCRRGWIIGGLALVAAAVSMLAYSMSASKNQVLYESVPVTRGDLRVTVRSTGTLQAVTSVEVGSELSGRVLKVLVNVNDEVSKGQILAQIDAEEFGSSLDQARAQLVIAKATISQAEATARESARTMSRNQDLAKAGIVSLSDLDASISTKERSDASLHSAQENARIAEASLDMAVSKFQKTTIRAPIDGVVLARLVEPGQTVTAGFQTPVIFKLAQDLRKMRLNVDIDEADVSRIRGGQLADFTVESYPGRSFPSRVVSLQMEPKIAQNVVTYKAVLTADNPELALLPGMTCTATIQVETKQRVLVIPNAALRVTPPAAALPKAEGNPSDGKHRVWILKANKPEPVEVKLGSTDGRTTEVIAGSLQEGMQVLTDTKEPS